jgi:glycosyltransferase involved in cell wall biosynthesis
VGIETEKWKPQLPILKEFDFLIYNKIRWNKKDRTMDLLDPIKKILLQKKLTYCELVYGSYKSADYFRLLGKSRAMIFLTEHESQGIAYQECLSMNVPILAWDEQKLVDPNYKIWNDADHLVTSVPYFDDRCGIKFKDFNQFEYFLPLFIKKLDNNEFSPRSYIMENLTLETSAEKMLEIIEDVYSI